MNRFDLAQLNTNPYGQPTMSKPIYLDATTPIARVCAMPGA
jgi:hypothetical protein